jgi:hypothetical protein
VQLDSPYSIMMRWRPDRWIIFVKLLAGDQVAEAKKRLRDSRSWSSRACG